MHIANYNNHYYHGYPNPKIIRYLIYTQIDSCSIQIPVVETAAGKKAG